MTQSEHIREHYAEEVVDLLKLFRHQEIALSYLRANDFFALFMEQG